MFSWELATFPTQDVISNYCQVYKKCHGPPSTEHVCKEMFPEGHHYDSQMKKPPYEIDLSQNTYTTWDTMDVSVKAIKPGEYFRGFFLQVRRANCSHPYQYEPLGTFTINPVDNYLLKSQNCLNNLKSAVSHRTNTSLSKAVVKWTAPAAKMGHLYFVATIVKEQDIFWTDVRSEIVTESGRDDQVYEYCPLKKLINPPHINTTPKPTIETSTSKTTANVTAKRDNGSQTLLVSYAVTSFGLVMSFMMSLII
ncbi:hypothetical protein ACF0H5_005358 [Mactra antiquata]